MVMASIVNDIALHENRWVILNCKVFLWGGMIKDTMKKNKSEITYHNKDVLSKILAENFKDKSLKVYGIDVPKIKQILPTNLPEIQVNEMRLDEIDYFTFDL